MFDSQNNNLERGLEWIFSHPELEEESEPALDMMDMDSNANANIAEMGSEGPRVKDGSGSKLFFSVELGIMLLCQTYAIHRAPVCFESSYCGYFGCDSDNLLQSCF